METQKERAIALVNYIAKDYVELSHDKVFMQISEYRRKARCLIEQFYREDNNEREL